RGDEHGVEGVVAVLLELGSDRLLLVVAALLRRRIVRARLGQVLADADPGRELTVQCLAEEEVHHHHQRRSGEEEGAGVEQREPDPDPRVPPGPPFGHGMRYPAPGTVSMTGGSPSLRRVIMMANRATPVNGGPCSPHAFSNSCSAETTPPSACKSSASTANSLRDNPTGWPSRVTVRRCGSRRRPARSSTGGAAGRARRPRAWTRATSSAKSNGL